MPDLAEAIAGHPDARARQRRPASEQARVEPRTQSFESGQASSEGGVRAEDKLPAGEAARDVPMGTATMTQTDSGTEFEIAAENMEPGMYGFHVHQIGECEPDSENPDDPEDTGDFKSAGGHIPGEEGAEHPDHAGDLPTLLVNEDGTGTMTVVTDRLAESELLDDDGAAIMVHSKPDNFANVPERYAEDGPDEDTLSTGDAGDRLACGVIEG